MEKEPAGPTQEEPGLDEFLRNPSMSGAAGEEEIAFLRRLKFTGKRPTAFYDYRELQNLGDPLNFRETSVAPSRNTETAVCVEKQIQPRARTGTGQKTKRAHFCKKQK